MGYDVEALTSAGISIPATLTTSAATVPHGTAAWQRATFTRLLARSPTPVTLAGLLGGTAISMTFLAKSCGVVASPASVTCVMFFLLADANTSAGAPWVICSASPELGPKLKVTLVPGCAASKLLPSSVNASVSDAAANTVIGPVMLADEVD